MRPHAGPRRSGWGAVRMQRRGLERTLQARHNLRLHGWLIGSFVLGLMWAASHAQMRLGVDSLALRYLVTLGVGYLGYLCLLRLWAARLVRRRSHGADGSPDLPDLSWPDGGRPGSGPPAPRSGGGGDFGGGGASGDFSALAADTGDADDAAGLGELAGGALEAAGSADEGAIVVVPVLAIFLLGAALFFGAGALALLYFGWDVLLAVAVELAFSAAAARAAMGVERAGWLGAAVRLTYKPLLGALLCAVLLGAGLDHFLPQAQSLPEALRLLRAR